MRIRIPSCVLVAVAIIVSLSAGQVPQATGRFSEDLLKGFSTRALGPYRAGLWVTSFAAPDAAEVG